MIGATGKHKDEILQHTSTFRVRFNETDPLGIVWHGHYITYFEDGREAFGSAFGISYQDIRSHELLAPIVKCTCEYKTPLRHGETARIETTYIDDPAAKVIFRYRIFNAQEKLVATGETIQVFTDLQGELQIVAPPFFAAWKAKNGLS